MKCLERNKTVFWYCLYNGKTPITDADSNETGEYKVAYSTAVMCRGNVSPAQGEAQVEQFGNSIDYDKVIILEDKNCPITEDTVLFVDRQPTYDSQGNPLFDYIVKRVAKSLNSGISYAITKVR